MTLGVIDARDKDELGWLWEFVHVHERVIDIVNGTHLNF